MNINEIIDKVPEGSIRHLAKAITLTESQRPDHSEQADQMLSKLMHLTGKSIRLGISGVPGVGKSTFIEKFGQLVINSGHRLAILAVDPTSPLTGGSIMGDKTRMEQLTTNQNTFIRPSPSRGALGGVCRRTRESILLCEAAGFDFIIIETVGVGQSEVSVSSMVDIFLMLQLPNAGDELQGIKKGILELADIIAVTKCDSAFEAAAKKTQLEQKRALSLIKNKNGEPPNVFLTSAQTGMGLTDIFEEITNFIQKRKESGLFERNRATQNELWLEQELADTIRDWVKTNPKSLEIFNKYRDKVSSGTIPAGKASKKILTELVKNL